MARYIDVDKLLEEIDGFKMNSSLLVNPAEVEEIIESQPIADVKPVASAKILSFVNRNDSKNSLYTCSNCAMSVALLPNYNYCEKCGAKLIKERDREKCQST